MACQWATLKAVPGPYEYLLQEGGHHPLADPHQPLEPLRNIHSYDPCMSCAVHVMDLESGNGIEVKAV